MEPQNQLLYQHFQQTINDMKQRQQTLVTDISTVKEQLASMEHELANLEISIISHQGGMSTIELLTSNNIALVQNSDEQPLTLSQFPATQHVTSPPAPQQYAQQPTLQSAAPQVPITQQAQQTFAPTQYPSPQDMAAAQAMQGPQIVQGPPYATE